MYPEAYGKKWERIFLLVAGYHSKFDCVQDLFTTSTKDVISALNFCSSVLDTAQGVICDSGTQFTSKEYKEFSTQLGFTMTMSSPYYTMGHGFIERQVQTIMALFVRCNEYGFSYQMVLYVLGATSLTPRPHLQNSIHKQAVENIPPSHHQTSITMEQLEHHAKPGRITAGMMCMLNRNLISSPSRQFQYRSLMV